MSLRGKFLSFVVNAKNTVNPEAFVTGTKGNHNHHRSVSAY